MTIARDNIDALTGLRFVAAFLIVLGHAYPPFLETTAIGMPLFFTLSGFIIHYVYSDVFAAGWGPRPASSPLRASRGSTRSISCCSRISCCDSGMGHTLAHPRNFPALFGYLSPAADVVAVPDRGHPIGYFYISWSVATEIFFTFCAVLPASRISRSVRSCLIILALFCVLAYAFFFALFITRDIWEPAVVHNYPQYIARVDNYNFSFYRWFLYLSPYCRLPEFIGGVVTCQLFRLSRQQRCVRDRVPPAAIGLVAIAVMAVLCRAIPAISAARFLERDRAFHLWRVHRQPAPELFVRAVLLPADFLAR